MSWVTGWRKMMSKFEDNIITWQTKKIMEMQDTIAHLKAKNAKLQDRLNDKNTSPVDLSIATQMELELNW
jgi:hypothetical protein